MISSIQEIKDIIKLNKRGFIILHQFNLKGYEGMYDDYSLIYKDNNISLRQTFTCYGLDGFGDDLYEYYEYSFDNSLEDIIIYVENKLKIKLKNMRKLDFKNIITQINSTEDQKVTFEKEWERFRQDYDSGKFLDKSLKLQSS